MYRFGQTLNLRNPVNVANPLGARIARGHWWKALAQVSQSTTILDLCGTTRKGTLTNGATWDGKRAPCNQGGSLRVAGASQEVLFGLVPTYDNCTQATMSAWLYISTAANKMGLGVRSGSGSMFNMAWAGDGNIYFQCTNIGLGVTSSFPNCTLGTGWHFVTAVYDGSLSGIARWSVWTDGTNRTLTAGGSSPPSSLGTTAFEFGVGRYSATDWGTGNADEIMLLPFALTGQECQQLYQATMQQRNPLLSWTRRTFPIDAAGSSFQAAWARGSNVLISPGAN